MGKRILILGAVLLAAASAFGVTTKDMAGGATADEIVKTLTGAGITITNVKVTGSQSAIGTFSGGSGDGLAIDAGVIMSSGKISTATGPNTSEGTTGALGTAGDAGLDSLVKPLITHDAVILEFDAVTSSSTFSIRYVFASEEYKEYVGSKFNDVFAFFVDGGNIALVPGTSQPVAVNTINHISNSGLFNDNPANSAKFGTSFDGFTDELTAVAFVSAGVSHHIRLAIADTSDSILDSAVFLAAGGISGSGVASAVVPSLLPFADANGDVPSALLLSNLDEVDVPVTIFGVPEGVTPSLAGLGLPDDSVVTFKLVKQVDASTFDYLMHVKIGPDTPAGAYPLDVRATLGDFDVFGSVLVVVDCAPPFILSSPGHQPGNTTVTSGQTANLTVTPNGTAAYKYQWFTGHSGNTNFPIAGATAATLKTPAITSPAEFWVRVSNPCGSVDSQTATVSPR